MASSDWVTPFVNLVSGTDAKAEDINERLNAIVAAFGKMAAPRSDDKVGFSEPVTVPDPVADTDAVNRGYVNELFNTINQNIAGLAAAALIDDPSFFSTVSYANIKTISDTTYSIIESDNGKVLWFASDDAVTVTAPGPTALALDGNIQCVLIQAGGGTVTVSEDGESSIGASGDLVASASRYSPMSLIRYSSTFWWLGGERV